MRRRRFLGGSGAILAAPICFFPDALAEQPTKLLMIGFLGLASPGAPFAGVVAAFRQGLRETGYVEGQNVAVEYRWAEDHYDRLPAAAADLVARHADVIVTQGSIPPALAAKNATTTIPIVFRPVPTRSRQASSPASPGRAATSPVLR